MQTRGGAEACKGVSGRKRVAFGGTSMRKRDTYEAHRAPQCERGAPVMSIGAPEVICKRGAPLRPIRASQGEREEPSGAPQCEKGAPMKPIGHLNVKEGRR